MIITHEKCLTFPFLTDVQNQDPELSSNEIHYLHRIKVRKIWQRPKKNSSFLILKLWLEKYEYSFSWKKNKISKIRIEQQKWRNESEYLLGRIQE